MRGDLAEFEEAPIDLYILDDYNIEVLALRAIHAGTKPCYTSPFLHATLSRECAVAWLTRARQGQGNFRADPYAYLVSIDLSKVPAERVIDLSTHALQEIFLRDRVMDDAIQRLIHNVQNPPTVLARSWREVLILGRGKVPRDILVNEKE